MVDRISWDDYFMTMVYLVAMRSKDESTHQGAVVVGPDNEVRSMGYNSFPRGINDDDPVRQERPLKYKLIEHSERNSLYNAILMGVSLKSCRMYVTGIPCADCARGIIQSGIKEVIVDNSLDEIAGYDEMWKESIEATLIMFQEAGVSLRYWKGNLIDIYKFRRGEKF